MRRNVMIVALLVFGIGFAAHVQAAEPPGGAAAAQQAIPLYRFQKGSDIAYAAMLEHRKMLEKEGGWQPIGVVGYVFTTKVIGTYPLYGLYKPGASYFYTTRLDDAIKMQKQGWSPIEFNKGIVCFVSATGLPTLRPVTRFTQPTNPVSYLYAFGKSEDAQFSLDKKLKKELGTEFFVWTSAVDEKLSQPKPDLAIWLDPKATASSVSVDIYNKSIGEFNERVLVMVTAYKPDNTVAWQHSGVLAKRLTGGNNATLTINLPPGKNLIGLRYKVKVDANNAIAETSEGNNETYFLNGPVGSTDTFATVDLSSRQSIYLVSPSGQKVPGKGGAPGYPMRLKKSEALECPDRCVYLIGIEVTRRPASGDDLPVYVQFKSAEGGSGGISHTFQQGTEYKEFVIKLGLRVGVNNVTVEIDRLNTVAERDELNNKFEVRIIVEP